MANLDLLGRPIPDHLVTDELQPLDDVLDALAIYWQQRDAEEKRREAQSGATWPGWDDQLDWINEPPASVATTVAYEDCPF